MIHDSTRTKFPPPAVPPRLMATGALLFAFGVALAQPTVPAPNRVEAVTGLQSPQGQVRSLQALNINGGAQSVSSATNPIRLNHSFAAGQTAGQPVHYRASGRSDFVGAAWMPYVPAPEFRIANANSRSTSPNCPQGLYGLIMYFQVRYAVPKSSAGNPAGSSAGFAESNVVSDTICVPID